MQSNHFQEALKVPAGLLLLVILHLWPLSVHPAGLALHRNADTMVSEWLISWPAHAWLTGNAHLFDANIFWPEPRTLTYGDPVLVPAIFAAPIRWLGGSPVLAFNLVTALGLLATALSCWLVARQWIGGPAAWLAGVLGAFNVHVLTRLPHLPASHLWGVPLALLGADRVADAPTPRRVAGLALVIAASAATSMYTLALVCVVVAVVGITRGRGDNLGIARRHGDTGKDLDTTRRRGESGDDLGSTRGRGERGDDLGSTRSPEESEDDLGSPWWRGWAGAMAGLGLACLLGLVLSLPVLVPYARFAQAGHERPLEVVAQFSATPAAYLSTQAWLHRGWSSAFFTTDVNALFPGALAVVLATVGLVRLARGSRRDRRRALTLVGLIAVGTVLSFGTHTAVYEALHRWVAPVRGIRVPARFGYLALLAIAVAAAAGLGAVITGLRAPARRPRLEACLVGAALVLATMEAWQGPVAAVPFRGLPRIYLQLSRLEAPVRLVEVPFYPPEAIHENAEYVLNSTLHWRPLLNGYSGFTPDSYRRRTETIWFFPERRAIDAIATEGATHVMVHLSRFGADRPDVERALATETRLELLAADPAGRRLYKVRE